jgi:hypothetical protein
VAHFRAGATPLLPITHAQAAPEPVVDFRDRPIAIRDPEVVHPAAEIPGELAEPKIHGDKPTPARELFDTTLEFPEGLLGPADANPSEGKAEKGGLSTRSSRLSSGLGDSTPCPMATPPVGFIVS